MLTIIEKVLLLQEIDVFGTKALFTVLKDDVAIDQKILTEEYVASVNFPECRHRARARPGSAANE